MAKTERGNHEVALAWRTDAAERANQILNAALDASRKAMAKGMNEGGSKIVTMVRDATEDMLTALAAQAASVSQAVAEYRRFNFWMLIGNCTVLIIALAIAAFR